MFILNLAKEKKITKKSTSYKSFFLTKKKKNSKKTLRLNKVFPQPKRETALKWILVKITTEQL